MRSTDYRCLGPIPEGLILEDRDIPNLPMFKINAIGHIRGIKNKQGLGKKWRHRAIFLSSQGTWQLHLWQGVDTHRKRIDVGELVARAFLPPQSEGTKLYYLDGDKQNHCAWNLSWMTRAEAIAKGLASAPPAKTVPEPVVIVQKPTKPPLMDPKEREQAQAEIEMGRNPDDVWLERFQSRMVLNTFLRMMR